MRTKEERRQEMFELIEQCQASEQTNKTFCKAHNINPAVFYYWQKRYREQQQEESAGFMQVKVNKDRQAAADMYIEYPNGVRLHVSTETDLSTLQQLIRLI